jgi:tripartite-type tricarboxylate transporter receptor subunit TctC
MRGRVRPLRVAFASRSGALAAGGWLGAVLLACGAAVFPSGGALAQAWPQKPVRVVVAFAAGGPADIVARLTAQQLEDSTGRTFLVENRAGAGGMTGTDMVARATPDGYTLLVTSSAAHAAGPALWPSVPYNPVTDFSHITLIGRGPIGLLVQGNAPWKSMADFLAAAKAKPGTINYGSGGPGGLGHLTGEFMQSVLGFSMQHVPYKGSAPAQADLLGGQIQAISDVISSHASMVRAGKLRLLGVASTARLESLPDSPTFAEQGFPQVVASAWFALTGPAKIPPDIVSLLAAAMQKGLARPETRSRLADLGLTPDPSMTTAQLPGCGKGEVERWARVVRERNIKID